MFNIFVLQAKWAVPSPSVGWICLVGSIWWEKWGPIWFHRGEHGIPQLQSNPTTWKNGMQLGPDLIDPCRGRGHGAAPVWSSCMGEVGVASPYPIRLYGGGEKEHASALIQSNFTMGRGHGPVLIQLLRWKGMAWTWSSHMGLGGHGPAPIQLWGWGEGSWP